MVTQIITLIGVLIGALASFLATAMAERAKFGREMAARWDERKLDAYIQYTSCIKEILRAARVVFVTWEAGEDRAPGLAAMDSAEAKRSVLFEGLVLLADEDAARVASPIASTSGRGPFSGSLVIPTVRMAHPMKWASRSSRRSMTSTGRPRRIF